MMIIIIIIIIIITIIIEQNSLFCSVACYVSTSFVSDIRDLMWLYVVTKVCS